MVNFLLQILICSLFIILGIVSYYFFVQIAVHIFSRRKIQKKIDQKYILITGCDSGFGQNLAQKLDKLGFNVIAFKLNPENPLKNASKRLKFYTVDLTNFQSVKNAINDIKSQNISLYGLVNNAGIWDGTFFETTQMEVYRKIMDINFFAHVNLTKELLPLISEGGRIVNTTSCLALFSEEGFSAYSASKSALQSFTDSLRRELSGRKITVSSIVPGYHSTKLLDVFLKDTIDPEKSEFSKNYGVEFSLSYRKQIDFNRSALKALGANNPGRVADAMIHALFSNFSLPYYLVGIDALVFYIMSLLPCCLSDLMVRMYFKRPAKKNNKIH